MFLGIGMGLVAGGAQTSIQSLLFAQNEPGFMFTPQDITTLYQDRAGTTPVTAVGQSVGLRLSKDKGLALGSEVGSISSGWAAYGATPATVAYSSGVTITNNGTTGGGSFAFASVIGRWYRIAVTIENGSGLNERLRVGNSVGGLELYNQLAGGATTIHVAATATTTYVNIAQTSANLGAVTTVSSFSVRELAGNHEVAINDAARGVYGREPETGRRNLLNATATLSTQSVTVTAVAHTLAFTGTGTVTLSGVSTAGPLVGTGAGNRVTLTFTPTAGSLTLTVTGSVTLAQLQIGSVDTAYQAVVSQYDVTEAGVASCYYVQTDGVDDACVTPTITPGTDKAQFFAGLQKIGTGATAQIIAEMSVTRAANNGAFTVGVPGSVAGAGAFLVSRGTVDATAQVTTGYTPPVHVVLTGLTDISGDVATLRANGSQIAQATTDQGTGNFLAYPAYLYASGGTTQPAAVRDYGHAGRFGPTLDAATIARVEALIARNTPEVPL